MKLLGTALAGGRSRRFGSPKALALLHGRPLWRVALDRLAAVCDRVVVVANDPRIAEAVEALHEGAQEVEALHDRTREIPAAGAGDARAGHAGAGLAGVGAGFAGVVAGFAGVVADRRPGLGPLAGIETALAVAADEGADGILALAVDMPWVSEDVLRRLAEAWREGGGRAAVMPRVAPGRPDEPLCAAYPVSALDAARRALDAGRGAAREFARQLRPVFVDIGGASSPSGPSGTFASVNEPRDLPPPAVSVVGNKNSGKTTFVAQLVAELKARGRRVMSAKHGHKFRVDTPGTDSWRHRHEGGAERVLLAGPAGFALMGDWTGGAEPMLDALLVRHLAEAEIVVAEGFRAAAVPKIEVFRAAAQTECVFGPARALQAGVVCAVTDQLHAPWPVPAFDAASADAPERAADLVERLFLASSQPSGAP